MMSYYIFPLISSLCIFFLGIFVFLKNKKSKLNIVFGIVCLTIFIWLFGTFLMFVGYPNEAMAIFFDRICYAGVVYITVTMYHFSVVFTKVKRQVLVVIMGYIISTVFLFLAQTKYFLNNLFVYEWGVHAEAQILHHIFLIFFTLYLFLFFLNLFKHYKRSSSNSERQQTKYIFLAFFIFTFAAIEFLPAYRIAVYPIFYFLGVVATSLIGYTIIQHRLMDIRIVVRQITIYGVSLAISIGFSVLLMLLALNYLSFYISSPLIGSAILVFGIIIFQLVKERFSRFANKHLFYTLYSYEKTLSDLAEKLSRSIELNRLVFLSTETIKDVIKLDKVALILKKLEPPKGQLKLLENLYDKKGILKDKEDEDDFYPAKNIAFEEEKINLLVKNKFLIHYLEGGRSPLIKDELSRLIEESQDEQLKKKILNIEEFMSKTGAAIYLPLIIENRLIGLFTLGKKVSGDAYTVQDINLLETVASQVAIAINNAQLYEQSQYFNQILRARVVEATQELAGAYRELKKLDDSKTEFLSLASHQLRTPLSAIKGYLSMVLEGNFGKLQKETRGALQDVYQSNERLITLVNDLLNITRIEAGRLEYYPKETNFEELVDGVIKELEMAAKNKGLELKYKISKMPLVNIDPDKIRQVLMNLIDNAIKYTGKGSVFVQVKRFDGKFLVEIKDTGIGISEEKNEHLFQWFSRGRGVYRLDSGGFGLGLYIAKKIVEKAGGKIWAESKGANKGSSFLFELPIK